jgi:hypothetical protein
VKGSGSSIINTPGRILRQAESMEALGPKPDPNTATVLFFLACNEDAAT